MDEDGDRTQEELGWMKKYKIAKDREKAVSKWDTVIASDILIELYMGPFLF